MNWTDIVTLIPSGDTLTTRFVKRVTDPSELAQIITAFANTIGGKIIIGLDRANLHFVGSTLSEPQLHEVQSAIFPSVSVSMVPILKGQRIIHVLTVEMGTQKPYRYNRTIYSLDESRPWSFKLKDEPMLDSIEPLQPDTHPDVDLLSSEAIEKEPVNIDVSPPESQIDLSQFNQRQRQALDYVVANGTIQNRMYRELFSVSHKTAHIELVQLMEAGCLVQDGSGRSTHYRAPRN